MKKAFVFTLDALFAVSILAVFFVVFSSEMNMPQETQWLPEIGNTLMTSLDKNRSFYQIFSQSNAEAEAMLASYLNLLPTNVNANISVKIYDVSVSPPFPVLRTIEARKGAISTSQQTCIKRVFSNPMETKIGLAELVISYG